jgi:hypothetical protein
MKTRRSDMYDRLCLALTAFDELFSTIASKEFLNSATLGMIATVSEKLEEAYQHLKDMQDDWEESIGRTDHDDEVIGINEDPL